MGGLLQPRWKLVANEQSQQIAELKETLAELQQEVASLRGRIKGNENLAAAANSRCERFEARTSRLEAQVAVRENLPNISGAEVSKEWNQMFLEKLRASENKEQSPPPSDEDAEPPTKHKTCPTCRGSGIVAWFSSYPMQTIPCTSCNGKGYVEVPI